ncbi:MAG TPA: KTSC domain-containing protein [Chitinophagaceae bacterium]|nr:KTSC domain-containing protein [Chitinophagaceae bacterium]
MPSTVISSFQYDTEKQILTITFVSGVVYNYMDIPENIYNEMKNSRNKGLYLNNISKTDTLFQKNR